MMEMSDVYILKKYKNQKELSNAVSKDDIKNELNDFIDFISHIEAENSILLVAERDHLGDAYFDCANMTRMQCSEYFSKWRISVHNKYCG